MTSSIDRKITVTRCMAFDPTRDGADEFAFEIPGKWGAPRLAARVRREFGATYAVRDISYDTHTYSMPVDDFMAHATQTD